MTINIFLTLTSVITPFGLMCCIVLSTVLLSVVVADLPLFHTTARRSYSHDEC